MIESSDSKRRIDVNLKFWKMSVFSFFRKRDCGGDEFGELLFLRYYGLSLWLKKSTLCRIVCQNAESISTN
jgi:hypothetical protein